MPRVNGTVRQNHAVRPATVWVVALATTAALAAEDGKRTVNVPRFGVTVRVPAAWNLVDWSHDDKAFTLSLPQDSKSQVGYVGCRMRVTDEKLDELKKRFAAEAEAAAALAAKQPLTTVKTPDGKKQVVVHRRMLKNEVAPLTSPTVPIELVERFGGRKLSAEWECEDSEQRRWFERRVLLVAGEMLYDFSFDCDEAHYDSYRIDFDEMLAGLKLSTIQLPVEMRPSGYWMQRDFRFGFKLADGWQPSFGPSDRVLFFAVGSTPQASTEQLSVLASPGKPLDFAQLKNELPTEWQKREPTAAVECRDVAQGGVPALETIVRVKRRGTDLTIVERRFSTPTRNYEIRLTCDTAEFARREAELKAMLDSFAEMPAAPQGAET
jgi:hypothetical protein